MVRFSVNPCEVCVHVLATLISTTSFLQEHRLLPNAVPHKNCADAQFSQLLPDYSFGRTVTGETRRRFGFDEFVGLLLVRGQSAGMSHNLEPLFILDDYRHKTLTVGEDIRRLTGVINAELQEIQRR